MTAPDVGAGRSSAMSCTPPPARGAPLLSEPERAAVGEEGLQAPAEHGLQAGHAASFAPASRSQAARRWRRGIQHQQVAPFLTRRRRAAPHAGRVCTRLKWTRRLSRGFQRGIYGVLSSSVTHLSGTQHREPGSLQLEPAETAGPTFHFTGGGFPTCLLGSTSEHTRRRLGLT